MNISGFFDIITIVCSCDRTVPNKGAGINMSEQKGKKNKSVIDVLSFSSQMGFTMAACVFIGVFLGRYLDNVLGTQPWLLLFFSLLGVAAAFRVIFKLAGERLNNNMRN